jgi:hypothetical protein
LLLGVFDDSQQPLFVTVQGGMVTPPALYPCFCLWTVSLSFEMEKSLSAEVMSGSFFFCVCVCVVWVGFGFFFFGAKISKKVCLFIDYQKKKKNKSINYLFFFSKFFF